VAQRTIDQRQIVINNLPLRRAIEELKVARDYAQLRSVLVAAFNSNDFDAFELHLRPLPGDRTVFAKAPATFTGASSLTWPQFPASPREADFGSGDNSKQPRGSLVVYRIYSGAIFTRCQPPDLEFPAILADALERVLTAPDASCRRRNSTHPCGPRISDKQDGTPARSLRQEPKRVPAIYLAPCLRSEFRMSQDGSERSQIAGSNCRTSSRRAASLVRQKLNTPVYASFNGPQTGMVVDLSELLDLHEHGSPSRQRRLEMNRAVTLCLDLPETKSYIHGSGQVIWSVTRAVAGIRFSRSPKIPRKF